jgi:hypothetical protein
MTEPILTCPTCRTEIKLTESLAAPLIADTRRRCETQLAQKEAEVAGREAAKAGELPQDFKCEEVGDFILSSLQGAILLLKGRRDTSPITKFKRVLFASILR